jgi:hypothetical protein
MPADVRAIDALREWLAALATYRSETAEALGGFRLEIGRGTDWVSEQMHLWQRAIRKCEDAVVQAKAELAARQFPDVNGRMPDTTVQERNLKRAKARLEHAHDKVATCRKWLTHLPKVIDEVFSGPANRLANTLEGDVPRGMATLERQIDALERYADLKTDYSASPSIGSTSSAPPPPTGGPS